MNREVFEIPERNSEAVREIEDTFNKLHVFFNYCMFENSHTALIVLSDHESYMVAMKHLELMIEHREELRIVGVVGNEADEVVRVIFQR